VGFAAVAPEISVLAIAAVVLLLDLFPSRERRGRGASGLFTIAAVCLGLTLLNTLSLRGTATLTDAFVLDPFALLAKRVLLAVALLSIIGLAPYVRARRIEHRAGESIVLILFTTVGGMVLVSAREWLTLFVAFELLSLPLYVMTCLEKDRPNAVEGAIKLFLFGSVSSAILLLGIALLFADRGGTFFADGNGRAAHAARRHACQRGANAIRPAISRPRPRTRARDMAEAPGRWRTTRHACGCSTAGFKRGPVPTPPG